VAGYELCPGLEEQASILGVELRADAMTALVSEGRLWQVASDGVMASAGAVLIATGATFKSLNVPGEERLRGRGVSHCASCDAPLLRDRRVAVIGGGDSALQEALTLADVAKSVVILHRGPRLIAQDTFIERVRAKKNIAVTCNVTVNEVIGDDVVRGLDAVRDGGEVWALEVDAVFVYVGLAPNSQAVSGLLGLDEDGKIPTDLMLRTSLPGVFAAGIIRSKAAGRAVAAAGDGALAAVAADRYLSDSQWVTEN
jgi:thioredoxin reductase (NADPH)